MKRLILPLLIIVWLTLFIVFITQTDFKPPQLSIPQIPVSTFVLSDYQKVKRVVDGDTIELESGQKVRYIGINTPETVDPRKPVECFGHEAKKENVKLVEGKTVRLEKDVSEKDKYNRLLRYVYIDDIFVNNYLVRNGFAQVSTFPPDVKYLSLFVSSEKEARKKNLGLWQSCPLK